MDAVRSAAQLAGAADFIDELPEGYETIIGEHGYSLSGGQRQRIAIARAVLADPRVLILDDATSSVDPTKEHEIRAALREVMTGRTTLIIAHRPATIALADRVVLLEGGRVLAEGTHEQLLETSERVPQRARRGRARDARRRDRGAAPMRGGARFAAVGEADRLSREEGQRVVKRLWAMLRPWRRRLVVAILTLLLQTACLLAGPALVKHGIDAGLRGHDAGALDLSAALYLCVAFGALVPRPDLAVPGRARSASRSSAALRVRVFRHLRRSGPRLLRAREDGPARGAHDVRRRRDAGARSSWVSPRSCRTCCSSSVRSSVIFILSWQLALCILIVVPPVTWASRWFRRESNRAYLEVRERIGHNLATLQEGLAGVRVVQAFGRERAFTRRFRETNEAQFDANLETVRISTKYFPFVEFCGVVGIAVIIGIGGLFVDQRHRDGRDGRRVRPLPQQPVRAGAAAQPAVQHGAVGRRRAQQAVRAPRHASRRSASDRARSTSRRTASLEVDDVSFAYGGPRRRAPRRRRSRSRPASGSRWSARPARASRRWPSSSPASTTRGWAPCASAASTSATRRSPRCAERIVVVPQEGFLFAGTIRDNVRIGRPEATDAEVDAALEALGVRGPVRGAARRARHRGAGAGIAPVGGRAPARVAGAGRAGRPRAARPRRGDVEPRPGHRARGGARARARSPRGGRSSSSPTGSRPRPAPIASRSSTTACSPSSARTTSCSAAKAATPASTRRGRPASPRRTGRPTRRAGRAGRWPLPAPRGTRRPPDPGPPASGSLAPRRHHVALARRRDTRRRPPARSPATSPCRARSAAGYPPPASGSLARDVTMSRSLGGGIPAAGLRLARPATSPCRARSAAGYPPPASGSLARDLVEGCGSGYVC